MIHVLAIPALLVAIGVAHVGTTAAATSQNMSVIGVGAQPDDMIERSKSRRAPRCP
jgi:hypothetical protein